MKRFIAILILCTLIVACRCNTANAQSREDQQAFYAVCMGAAGLGLSEPDVARTSQGGYINAITHNAKCNCAWRKVGRSLGGYADVINAAWEGSENDDPRANALAQTSIQGIEMCTADAERAGASNAGLQWVWTYRGHWRMSFLQEKLNLH